MSPFSCRPIKDHKVPVEKMDVVEQRSDLCLVFVNKREPELFLAAYFIAICVFYRGKQAPWGQQEKWAPRAKS